MENREEIRPVHFIFSIETDAKQHLSFQLIQL